MYRQMINKSTFVIILNLIWISRAMRVDVIWVDEHAHALVFMAQ